jgi:hypothetical protein
VDPEDWEWELFAEHGLSPSSPLDLPTLHRLVPGAEELDLVEQASLEAAAAEQAELLQWMSWPDTAAPRRVPPHQPELLESDDWPYGRADWQGRPGIDRPHLHVEVVEPAPTPRQAEALVLHVLGGEIVATTPWAADESHARTDR